APRNVGARFQRARSPGTLKTCRHIGGRIPPAHLVDSSGLDIRRKPAYIHNHMVLKPTSYGQRPSARLDATFAALADPTRRAILARLATGEASVTELARPFAMSQPAISKH